MMTKTNIVGASLALASCLFTSVALAAPVEILHTFSEYETYPPQHLIQAADGDFYGTAGEDDGPNITADVFRMYKDGNGVFHKQWFSLSCAVPEGIMQASDGGIYVARVCGTIEKIQGGTVSTFADLSSLADKPSSRLLEASDGNFYGTTDWKVYRVTPAGVVSTLHVFNITNGAYASGGLIQGTDGALYGTTLGSDWGNGFEGSTIFKITTNGLFTSLHTFTGGNVYPNSIIQGTDGNFYGTTSWEQPTIFKMTPGGIVTTLHTFDTTQTGRDPRALIETSPGVFYGATQRRGSEVGSIFKITAAGTLTLLHQFAGVNPHETDEGPSQLVLANDGYLYGTLPDRAIYLGGVDYAESRSTLFRLREDLSDDLPYFRVHPVSQTNAPATLLELTANAASPEPLSYQWQKNGTDLVDGANLSGSTSWRLTVNNTAVIDSGNYTVIASNSSGSVTSLVAVVQISNPFINHLEELHVRPYGGQATLTVDATGSGTLGYQWSKDGTNLVNGGNISGATSATLVINNLVTNDNGFYTVTVTNGFGSVEGTTRLSVYEPAITLQPQPLTVTAGMSATFTAQAAGSSTISYQWRKTGIATNLVDGDRISGATSPTLTIDNVTSDDAGYYYVVVTNDAGSRNSSTAKLTVASGLVITTQPVATIAAAGMSTTFSVTAAGPGPFTYQWQKAGVPLVNGGNISGATSATLTLSNVTTSDAGSYSVIVGNGITNITSSTATLTVTTTTSILSQPSNQTNLIGSTAIFAVSATGEAPLFYQWLQGTITNNSFTGVLLNEGSKYSGTQTDTLSINNVGLDDATTYFVLIGTSSSNLFLAPTCPGTALSDVASLTVLAAPTVSKAPTSRTILVGSSTTLSVTASGVVGYQWHKDGFPLPGATTSALVINNAQFSDTGAYSVDAIGVVTSITAGPAQVTVLRPKSIYNGLFHESDAVRHETAGFITVKTSGTNFSGKILSEGLASSFTGKLALDGTGTKTIIRTNFGRENLTLRFSVDQLNEQVTGTISNSQWTASVLADYYPYSLTNPATAFTGYYTLAFPGFSDGAEGPVGFGCASILVNSLGNQRLAGVLADGQPFRSSVRLSSKATTPIYSPAYLVPVTNHLGRVRKEARGSTIGWLTITNSAPQGTLSWIKTGWTNALYSTGFTNEQAVISSRHLYTPGVRVMAMTNGFLTFSGGNLAEPFSANVLLKTNNVLSATLPQTNKAVVSLAPRTGLYSGSFRHPENTNIVTRFKGVILQQQNYGAGYFAGTNHNGATLVVPE